MQIVLEGKTYTLSTPEAMWVCNDLIRLGLIVDAARRFIEEHKDEHPDVWKQLPNVDLEPRTHLDPIK
jgi:hypothetical protein